MALLLLRHAGAGSRQGWTGDDRERPLDEGGRRQALELARALSAFPIERIVSSPFARCLETVAPLATTLHLEVETRDELSEGAALPDTLALLRELGARGLLCTHGDVIARLVGLDRPRAKGSTWILEPSDGGFSPAAYLHPPGV